jgi:hypothetical protein
MLAMGLGPLGIPLQARRVGHLQLFGEVVDDLDRHTVQRISQEPAQIAHRRQLDTEPQAVVITPVTPDGQRFAVLYTKVQTGCSAGCWPQTAHLLRCPFGKPCAPSTGLSPTTCPTRA